MSVSIYMAGYPVFAPSMEAAKALMLAVQSAQYQSNLMKGDPNGHD